MKIYFMFSVASALFLVFMPGIAHGSQVFNRNLYLGVNGSDVTLLQKVLNQSQDTIISPSGPGSLGQETPFFGLKTKLAVIKFQQKYSSSILTPFGLYAGTGFVGASTRQKLESLYEISLTVKNNPGTASSSYIANPNPLPTSVANPNLENLDTFLSKIKNVESKKGKNSSEIDRVVQGLRQFALATTTNLTAQFESKVAKSPISYQNGFQNIFTFISPFVKHALAQVGLQNPFGGVLYYAIPCTCSAAVSLVFIGAPSFVLLDYTYGTQRYANYNAPYASYYLGFYNPESGESCEMYIGEGCTVIPAEGNITTLGTSAL